MKERLIVLAMVMSLVVTGCNGAKEENSIKVESTPDSEVELGMNDVTEQVTVTEQDTTTEQESVAEQETVPKVEAVEVEQEKMEEAKEVEETKKESSEVVKDSSKDDTKKTQSSDKKEEKKEEQVQKPVVEDPVLENADHPFFEVFLAEHCYEDDGEYYYWGFYMPYGCDTDNCAEYDQAYYELMCKMKGERSYVFYGLDGEFADLGQYSFVRVGYKVPTEYMPETLTILYEDNVHWGKSGYIVYYTEEESNLEEWWNVYNEFVEIYVSYDSQGRMNLYHDTRYFVDGEVKCFYVWEN